MEIAESYKSELMAARICNTMNHDSLSAKT
jgi:hypothetical protein